MSYWNNLTKAHLSDVVMILTATILVLLDKPVWQLVNRLYRPKSRVLRFVVFVAVCSFGYAALTIILAKGLRWFLTTQGGGYTVLQALFFLVGAGIVAARQKHI